MKKIEDETVKVNGVEVSVRGSDKGPQHIWSRNADVARENLHLEEIQQGAREKRVIVARRRSILDRLLEDGHIDQHKFDAGEAFSRDYHDASLSGYHECSYEPTYGGLSEGPPLKIIRARNRIAEAVKAMGGKSSRRARIAIHLLGDMLSIKALSGGNRVKEIEIRTQLNEALYDLAGYYYPHPRKRC